MAIQNITTTVPKNNRLLQVMPKCYEEFMSNNLMKAMSILLLLELPLHARHWNCNGKIEERLQVKIDSVDRYKSNANWQTIGFRKANPLC
jgi:hypothetical protein